MIPHRRFLPGGRGFVLRPAGDPDVGAASGGAGDLQSRVSAIALQTPAASRVDEATLPRALQTPAASRVDEATQTRAELLALTDAQRRTEQRLADLAARVTSTPTPTPTTSPSGTSPVVFVGLGALAVASVWLLSRRYP